MKISPVQKQTKAGQRTRFKAFVVVGDCDGHVGLGGNCSKEVCVPTCSFSQCLICSSMHIWFQCPSPKPVACGDYRIIAQLVRLLALHIAGVPSLLACSQVATAIRAAIQRAKVAVVPLRRDYWGNKIGGPHTVPCKETGKCGSCRVRLVPAPRGSGLVAAPVPKKLLQFAGVEDCFTQSTGQTRTLGNFVKVCT